MPFLFLIFFFLYVFFRIFLFLPFLLFLSFALTFLIRTVQYVLPCTHNRYKLCKEASENKKRNAEVTHAATNEQRMEWGTRVSVCAPACLRDTLAYQLQKACVVRICHVSGWANESRTRVCHNWWRSSTSTSSWSPLCSTHRHISLICRHTDTHATHLLTCTRTFTTTHTYTTTA